MRIKVLVGTSLVTVLLSGCSFIDAVGSLRSFGADPLVVAATEDPMATRNSVMAVGKKPRAIQPTKNIQGTCYDFELNSGSKSAPFYVAFNKKDQVVGASFLTCAIAESRGLINNELPFIERKK